jgi:mannose-1-phosphate guanylyltransferase
VKRFREKPNPELAEQFLSLGRFSWNAGMFVWSLPTVIEQLTKHAPELSRFVSELRRSRDIHATIAAQFPKLTPISIDYCLMENADRVLNIEATFDWDDVGSWVSVAKYLEKSGCENRSNEAITEIDSENNIVFNARPGTRIALLGVDDLIIVQTGDALLIANRHQADAIKKLVDILPPELL